VTSVTVGLASRILSEGVIQFVPAPVPFLPTTSHMDCRGIESSLLCTFQAKSRVTAHCSFCEVELRSIRDGAAVSVVFFRAYQKHLGSIKK